MSAESKLSELVKTTSIPGLYKFESPVYRDERGEFQTILQFDQLTELGIDFVSRQFQRSVTYPNALRGNHAEPFQKLVVVAGGMGESAIVDLRPESPTFLKNEIIEWEKSSRFALFIPKGCSNSLANIGKTELTYIYLQDHRYNGKSFPSIAWNDPALGIPWTLKNPILSPRDNENALTLSEFLPRRLELFEEYLSG